MSLPSRSKRFPVVLPATIALIAGLGFSAPAAAVDDGSDGRQSSEKALTRDDTTDGTTGTDTDTDRFAAESESGLWIVQLGDSPLASYEGGLPDLRATSPRDTGEDRLDINTRSSIEYLEHLADEHDDARAQIEEELGREVEIAYDYRSAFNGMAIEVDAEEAELIEGLADVETVTPDEVNELDTDVSQELISAPAIWDGQTPSDVGSRGEGVIVGMLDSGVNPFHPSFAATDGDGYTHTNPFGAGTYVGVCDPAHPHHDDICNDKLIGAWDFTSTVADARDADGHGSHVGSTIAGNKHDAIVTIGDDEHVRTIQGVAPRANVISYRVCAIFGCFSTAAVAAVDQAIADGTDVLNYSISGSDRPWTNTVDQAFLGAFDAGIYIAASAGNDGPDAGTVAKTAPWNATVAATTHQRVIANVLDVTSPDPAPPELTGIAAVLGDGSPFTGAVEAQVKFVDPADADDQGCEPFDDNAFDGTVALIKRGGCNFSVKVDNAADAGAVGVVVFNQFAGPPVVMGALDGTTIPAVMVSNDDGLVIHDFVASADQPVTVRIGTESTVVERDEWADVVADFSSRGPSDYDLLAPTFAAPGRNILAATAADGDEAVQYEIMQGTSMASPHGAGAGALLKALHPEWSPAQIRSALALSSDRDGVVKQDGETPADPFDVGSGRVNLDASGRAAVVLDETHENFVAANPATGGDPAALNLPALVNQACDESCSWTRTLTSVADVAVTYTATAVAPNGMPVTITPNTFTIAPGGTQELSISMDVSDVVGGDWVFGSVELTTDSLHGPDGLPVSDAHLPLAVVPAEAEINVDPSGLSALLDVAQQAPQALTIANTGGAVLEWSVDTNGPGCKLPDWVSVSPTSGTVEPGGEAEVTVTFDSTDMTGGDYSATLCLSSNDPHTPTASVDLDLTVVEIPVVDVADADITATQPIGTVTGSTMAIANAGWGTLNWTLDDEDAGPSDERIELLRDGVLLAPNSARANRGVMAFDPENGTLLDPEFIPHVDFDPSSTLYTPVHVLPKLDGSGFLVADQIRWMITEYDLSGNYQGIFAPLGGSRDPSVMANIRSITWSPDDTLLVTVAAQDNAHSVVELDTEGNYLGQFIPAGLDDMAGPWFALFRDDDILVSASNSDAIHSFSLDGKTANERFVDDIPWPEQLVELDNGNILTVNWGGGTGSAVHEYDPDGNLVDRYTASGSSYTGVHPLGNGNILVSTSTGVYEISRDGSVLETEFSGGRGRYFTHVQMPDAMACSTPDEVPWLSVSVSTGSVEHGSTDSVTVAVDSAGLSAGDYRAQLCLTTDDPDMPLVTIPVSLTVTAEQCTETISEAHFGPLSVSEGMACLAYGSSVAGPLNVTSGAAVFAQGATVSGPVSAMGARSVEFDGTAVSGPVTINGVSGTVSLTGNYVQGPVMLANNVTGDSPIVLSGNTIFGPLHCTGNEPPPVDNGVANDVSGPQSGQCAFNP